MFEELEINVSHVIPIWVHEVILTWVHEVILTEVKITNVNLSYDLSFILQVFFSGN